MYVLSKSMQQNLHLLQSTPVLSEAFLHQEASLACPLMRCPLHPEADRLSQKTVSGELRLWRSQRVIWLLLCCCLPQVCQQWFQQQVCNCVWCVCASSQLPLRSHQAAVGPLCGVERKKKVYLALGG